MKSKIWYAARFWVALHTIIVAMMLVLQAMASLESTPINVSFPMDLVSWCQMALMSAYIGSDRLEKIVSSKEIPYGEVFMGDMANLRRMIAVSLLIFLESAVLTMFFEGDYGLEGFFTAFSSSAILYISGNKMIKTMGNVNGEHPVEKTGDENKIMDLQVGKVSDSV